MFGRCFYPAMTAETEPRTLTTTETSLAVLEHVRRRGGATLPELVAALDKPKSTVYGHVVTLERNGYLVAEGGTYHVGLKLLRFGERAKSRKPSYDLAKERVDELVDETGEEGGFLVEENGRPIMLYNSAAGSTSLAFNAGRMGFMHDNAAGKAMLPEMDDGSVERILDRWGLPARTSRTITDRGALLDELQRIRERGYAVTEGEHTEGLYGIAAAVTDSEGDVFGAFSLGLPSFRAQNAALEADFVEPLKRAVDALESDLAERNGGQE